MASSSELGLEALAGALVDLGAVLVVLEATLALEVAVHLGRDDALGDRHLDLVEDGLEQLVAGRDALGELGVDLGLGGEVGLELVERVELGGQLGELVVELGQLALLDRGDGHGAVGVLALRSPPASGAVKVLVSSAVMPMSASSRPSSMFLLPTS